MTTSQFQQFVEERASWFRGEIKETAESIESIEKSLGVPLPASLRWLLVEFGYSDATYELSLEEAVEQTRLARTSMGFPHPYIVLIFDGDSMVVIDTKNETSPEEYAVSGWIGIEDFGPTWELTSPGFDSYGAFLANSLAHWEVPPTHSSALNSNDKLVLIANFSSEVEAHLARNKLEAAGIRTSIEIESTRINFYLAHGIGCAKLSVLELDVERAIAALASG